MAHEGAVTEEDYNPHVEVVSYRGHRLVVRQTPLDWVVSVLLLDGSRIPVVEQDRDSALAKARQWVDHSLGGREANL
jgi:hypothetical protein